MEVDRLKQKLRRLHRAHKKLVASHTAQAEVVDRLRAENARLHGLTAAGTAQPPMPAAAAAAAAVGPLLRHAAGGGGQPLQLVGGGGRRGGGASRPESLALVQWLEDVGLGRYADGFAAEGFDELPLLLGLGSSAEARELASAVGMRRGDAARFSLRLAELQAGWSASSSSGSTSSQQPALPQWHTQPPPSPFRGAAGSPANEAVVAAGRPMGVESANMDSDDAEHAQLPASSWEPTSEESMELAGLVEEGVLTPAELQQLTS